MFEYAVLKVDKKTFVCIVPSGRDNSEFSSKERDKVLSDLKLGIEIVENVWECESIPAFTAEYVEGDRAKSIIDYMDECGHLDADENDDDDKDDDYYQQKAIECFNNNGVPKR